MSGGSVWFRCCGRAIGGPSLLLPEWATFPMGGGTVWSRCCGRAIIGEPLLLPGWATSPMGRISVLIGPFPSRGTQLKRREFRMKRSSFGSRFPPKLSGGDGVLNSPKTYLWQKIAGNWIFIVCIHLWIISHELLTNFHDKPLFKLWLPHQLMIFNPFQCSMFKYVFFTKFKCTLVYAFSSHALNILTHTPLALFQLAASTANKFIKYTCSMFDPECVLPKHKSFTVFLHFWK